MSFNRYICKNECYEKSMSDKLFNIFSEIQDGNAKLDLHMREYQDYVYFCVGSPSLLNSIYIYNTFCVRRTKCCGRCEGERGEVGFIQINNDRGLNYYCSECFIDEILSLFGFFDESENINIVEMSENREADDDENFMPSTC